MKYHLLNTVNVSNPSHWAYELLKEQGYQWKDSEFRNFIVLTNNNQTLLEFIGSDGGEPEDQTLGRDFAWVVDELNRAYALGYENQE